MSGDVWAYVFHGGCGSYIDIHPQLTIPFRVNVVGQTLSMRQNWRPMNISRRLKSGFLSGILITLFTILSGVAAMADPPGRAVDIRYISGQVSIQPGGVNDWVAAVVNRPLTSADRVWTDKDSRAELHLGSSALRMNAETSMTLTNVNDQTVQVELDQGTLNLWVRHLYDGEIYEVDTPNLAFTVTKSGDYRFDVDPNGDTTMVSVRHGEGEATGQGNAVKVRSGQMATFSNGNSLQHQFAEVGHPDGFDDWCKVRDERQEHGVSARYVSPDVVGADDLDEYGTWRTEPGYGAVWVPAGLAPGWAPYHYGHWVWVEPWGWTWVDDAPWGYAPCHYGRWVFYGGVWGWSPGPVVVGIRPVYAPALVAWVGGAHWGVGIGFGGGVGVGWFPLGFGEPYVPSYAVSRNYFRNVNVSNTRITNITNVTNNYYTNNNTTINNTTVNNSRTNIHYANQTVPGAMTAVPASAITNSQPVAKAAVPVPLSEAAKAPMSTTPGVAPAKASVLGVNAGALAATPPAQAVSRQVVTKAAPPAKPIPFEAKQEALAKNPGRPLNPQAERQIRSQLPQQHAQMQGAQPQGRAPGNAGAATGSNSNVRNAPGNNQNPAAKNAPGNNAATGRVVPRPPSAGGGNTARSASNNAAAPRPQNGQTSIANNAARTRSVPRPPNSGGNQSADKIHGNVESSPKPPARARPRTADASNRAVPRPPNGATQPASHQRNAVHEAAPRPAPAERNPVHEAAPHPNSAPRKAEPPREESKPKGK
jgi:hypothetical protein